jgi:hypothetical protein
MNNIILRKNFEELTNEYLPILKKSLEGTDINIQNIHVIVKIVMEIVEITELKGTEQKEFCIKLLKKLFIEFTENETEDILLTLIDNGMIGNMIDLIVDASKGKLNINKLVDTTAGCCKFWIPRFSKKIK